MKLHIVTYYLWAYQYFYLIAYVAPILLRSVYYVFKKKRNV